MDKKQIADILLARYFEAVGVAAALRFQPRMTEEMRAEGIAYHRGEAMGLAIALAQLFPKAYAGQVAMVSVDIVAAEEQFRQRQSLSN